MRRKTIPQRELRNDIAAILREAEAGTEFTVTVRGRPVAKVVPLDERAGAETLTSTARRCSGSSAESPVDEGWAADLAEMRAARAADRRSVG